MVSSVNQCRPNRRNEEADGGGNSAALGASLATLGVATRFVKMTRCLTAFLIAISIAFDAGATSPPMKTPAAPAFRAAEAARLGDEYVAKKFPQFPTLYCSEVSYDSDDNMKPDPSVIWRLRYIIPNNPRKEVPGSRSPDWGVCLVYVHKDKTVTHTTEPKQNPK